MEQREPDFLNEVVLRGRVSGEPQVRELPSGSSLVSFRLVVGRQRTAMTAASKQVSDWVECAAWSSALRKRALGWAEGDQVEIRGALRRRYFQTGGQARTSVEIEVLGGRLVRRAGSGGRQSVRAATG